MANATVQLDVLIFGGGAAGLWLLDELCERGHSAFLAERRALGDGQTIASQGIIHGGVKYTLSGSLTPSARAIREMPQLWRDCLEGRRRPALGKTAVLANGCHLWRTESLKSKLGMVGARMGLRSGVSRVNPGDRPDALRGIPGDVFLVDEQVIDVVSFVANLRERHRERLLRIADPDGAAFSTTGAGRVRVVTLHDSGSGATIEVQPTHLVLAAGVGNQALREQVGLVPTAMQRRPLHMVLARGPLPRLFGHCVDGAKTRVTVTVAQERDRRVVWQVGGQIAEDGVRMTPPELIAHARRELAAVLPGLDFSGVEWATYRIDRAEGRTSTGRRPEGPTVHVEGNVVTAWPTKLALVPELARIVADRLSARSSDGVEVTSVVADWSRPDVARPPWEVASEWQR